jgi:hypothetical protein
VCLYVCVSACVRVFVRVRLCACWLRVLLLLWVA